MTNIRTGDMFPIVLPEVHQFPSKAGIDCLLGYRKKTYRGFADIEKEKGLLKPEMSLSTSEGQEAVRILTQRGLEEMAEAFDSVDRDHYLEELIDAINYFWVLAIIDPTSPIEHLASHMTKAVLDTTFVFCNGTRISYQDLGKTVVSMNPIFEKLRHRAWMHNIQQPYFNGWLEIANFLADNLCLILDQFESWQEFVSFFIAKDNVLQFRLKTKY